MKHRTLVQRLHPELRVDMLPSVARKNRLEPLLARQGIWDSGCGAHCVAMAMALAGELHSVVELAERRRGVAGRLWRAAQATYFDGATLDELAAMIESLRTGRSITSCAGTTTACLPFALAALDAGSIVLVSWHSRHGRQHHFALLVGSEGVQSGANYTPHALLALDPGVDDVSLCGYNARLEFTVHPRPVSPLYFRYASGDGNTLAVRLTGALAIGDRCN